MQDQGKPSLGPNLAERIATHLPIRRSAKFQVEEMTASTYIRMPMQLSECTWLDDNDSGSNGRCHWKVRGIYDSDRTTTTWSLCRSRFASEENERVIRGSIRRFDFCRANSTIVNVLRRTWDVVKYGCIDTYNVSIMSSALRDSMVTHQSFP